MFDIGWSELLVLGALALIVVGPKDLPGMLRTLGQTVGQAKRMARDFQRSMEDAAREVDVSKDIGKEMRDVQSSLADFNAKMGADAPRKYAEKVLNGDASGAGDRPPPAADADSGPSAAETAAPEPRPAAPPPASNA